MRRTDLVGVSLEEHRERIRVLRMMGPAEKLREMCRLIEEARAKERAYRASLFALRMACPHVGQIVRIAPDVPRR